MPSHIIPVKAAELIAAPTTPGVRLSIGDMALNKWVKHVAPAANAARVCSAVASVWPSETIAPVVASSEICAGVVASGASVIITTSPACRRCLTMAIVASSIGRTKFAAWVPRRATAICGPSMCKPNIPPFPLLSKAAVAACANTSARSVITVGKIPTVPKRRCAAAIVCIETAVGVSFNKTPPPPFTCKSKNPGVTKPRTARLAAPSGMLVTVRRSVTWSFTRQTAMPDKTAAPSNSASGHSHIS